MARLGRAALFGLLCIDKVTGEWSIGGTLVAQRVRTVLCRVAGSNGDIIMIGRHGLWTLEIVQH